MNWAQIETHWDFFGAQAQDRWGRLTDDDMRRARTGRDELLTCVLERYRIDPEIASRHVDDWIQSANLPSHDIVAATPAPTQHQARQ